MSPSVLLLQRAAAGEPKVPLLFIAWSNFEGGMIGIVSILRKCLDRFLTGNRTVFVRDTVEETYSVDCSGANYELLDQVCEKATNDMRDWKQDVLSEVHETITGTVQFEANSWQSFWLRFSEV